MTSKISNTNDWATAIAVASIAISIAAFFIVGMLKTGRWPWE